MSLWSIVLITYYHLFIYVIIIYIQYLQYNFMIVIWNKCMHFFESDERLELNIVEALYNFYFHA